MYPGVFIADGADHVSVASSLSTVVVPFFITLVVATEPNSFSVFAATVTEFAVIVVAVVLKTNI